MTSVTAAVHIVTFPLLKPLMILATTNSVKLLDTAHITYETNTPIYKTTQISSYKTPPPKLLAIDFYSTPPA